MHNNLQRDVRDIRAQREKIRSGQHHTDIDQLQRARLWPHDVAALLSTQTARSVLIDAQEVNSLIHHLHFQSSAASTSR